MSASGAPAASFAVTSSCTMIPNLSGNCLFSWSPRPVAGSTAGPSVAPTGPLTAASAAATAAGSIVASVPEIGDVWSPLAVRLTPVVTYAGAEFESRHDQMPHLRVYE